MLQTYQGILRDNRIEWSGDAPEHLPHDQGVRVHVTLLEKAPAEAGDQGERMAAALERLAETQALSEVSDPATWERETRQDRPLPGREP